MSSGEILKQALDAVKNGRFEHVGEHLDKIEKQMTGKGTAPALDRGDPDRQQMIAAGLAGFAQTPAGAAFLEDMASSTIWRQTYPAFINTLDRDQRCDFAAWREGQNSLAASILRLVLKGRGEDPPPPRQEM